MLEYAYRAKKKPGSVAMRELAELAGITFLQCKSWFQYQRKKKKRREEENEVNALKAEHNFKAEDVAYVRARVDPQHRKVCDIPEPTTGLEIKFSLRHCLAMALSNLDTGDRDIYTDELANCDDLIALRRKVELEDKSHNNRHAAEVVISLNNGTSLMKFFDVGAPAHDIDVQETRLTDKFLRLACPVIGDKRAKDTLEEIKALDTAANIEPLMVLVE